MIKKILWILSAIIIIIFILGILLLMSQPERLEVKADGVYYYGKLAAGIDPASFEILNYDYAKDKNNAYYISIEKDGLAAISSADPASFKILDSGYAKDKNYVYFEGSILEGADPDNFLPPQKSCGTEGAGC